MDNGEVEDPVENPVRGEVEHGKEEVKEEQKSFASESSHDGRNYESKFLTTTDWEDEKLNLDEWIVKGLIQEGFKNPSKI